MSCLDCWCSAATAIRSSFSLRLSVSAFAACRAWLLFAFSASSRSTFFTYCCAMVEPPWTGLCWMSFTAARMVPRRSIAPCSQYLESSMATTAFTMFGVIWL